jgi:tRNA(adenine34) deaminase
LPSLCDGRLMCAGADEQWIRMAIEVARSKGSDPSTSPLGCAIVLDGQVIAAERNQTQELSDATAHAEMMAIRRACEGTGEMKLRGATLYSTLQPCGMCTMASIWSKVGRVVYGAGRDDVHLMYFEAKHVERCRSSATPIAMISRPGGCLGEECAPLLPASQKIVIARNKFRFERR